MNIPSRSALTRGTGMAGLVAHVRPVTGEYDGRKHKTKDHVDDHTGGEGNEWFHAGVGKLFKACSQSNTKKAEDECPGPQILDRAYHFRYNHLFEVGLAIVRGDERHNDRGQHESDDEFR